jgi:hypothetical protein
MDRNKDQMGRIHFIELRRLSVLLTRVIYQLDNARPRVLRTGKLASV